MRYLFVGLIFFLFSIPLPAQCDETLVPIDNPTFGYKSYGNRCEGFYKAKVNATGLEIVSFTRGTLNTALADQSELTIHSNQPGILVRATGIPLDLYYRMDAQAESDGSFTWPLTAVVLKKDIRPHQLGVYGWERQTPVIYRPLDLKIEDNSNYYLLLRSSKTFVEVQWRLVGSDLEAYTEFRKLSGTRFWAGKPIKFTFPPELEGNCILEIAVREMGKSDFQKKIFELHL